MNLMDLFVKIGVDKSDFDKGLDSASGKATSLASKIGSGLKTAAKVGAAAVTAASATVGKLLKDSIEAYADYEQLVGGVETLFKNNADAVMEYANNAYKTAGLSANNYMETVTSFSASLLQSLGGDTQKAADYADMAITDMADNANKMGSSMEAIQNAYQGFAKQNFTMLDNLKLGYGGTKQEMERLLEDATALSGIEYNIESYADIVDAIHVVQTELGITGTTAKEAATTISGSVASMKSAWKNLVTGIADDNADLDNLIGNLVDSAETAFNNIMPVAEKALSGIGTFIEKIAPIISDKLPGIVQQVLPALLNAATSLVNGVLLALPSIVSVLIDQAPVIIGSIVDTIISMLPQIIDLGVELIISLAEGLVRAIPRLIAAVPQIISNLVGTIIAAIPQLIAAGIRLVVSLASGLIQAIPELVLAIPALITAIVGGIAQGIQEIVKIGGDLVAGLWQGIKGSWDGLVKNVKDLAGGLVDGIKGLFGIHSPSKVFAEIGKNLDAGLGKGIEDNFKFIDNAMDDLNTHVDVGITKNVNGSINGSSGPSSTGSFDSNNITINVYGAQGQDINELAEIIEERLSNALYRQEIGALA